MSDPQTTPFKIPSRPITYWAGYDGSQRNLLGFPKMVQLFRTRREAMKHYDIVYRLKISGEP
jgi:hypothetical protein